MPSRYKTVVGILALGFGMTCFATYMAMLLTRSNGREPVIADLLARNSSFWMGWAVLSLPIIALCKRVRIERRDWKRGALVHARLLGGGKGRSRLSPQVSSDRTDAPRLSHHYGANYRFEFHKRPGSFAVIIALPWKAEASQPAPRVA